MQARPPLQAVPTRPVAAAGDTVVRLPLGASEWALVVAPPGPSALRPAPACLTGPHIRPLPGQFALVRVPGSAALPGRGRAVLHYRRGRTLAFCPSNQITDLAACVLPALAGQAIDSALAGQGYGEGADQEPRIAVAPVGHDLLPADLHPAVSVADGQDVTIFACSDLITAALAEVLSILWTAHIRCLLHPGRPITQARDALADPRSAPRGDRASTGSWTAVLAH
jgi:hypothetical protein